MKTEDRKIVFNHFYALKHDLKRTYIFSKERPERRALKVNINNEWITKVHPIYAMLFSLASHPIDLNDFIKEVAEFIDIDH